MEFRGFIITPYNHLTLHVGKQSQGGCTTQCWSVLLGVRQKKLQKSDLHIRTQLVFLFKKLESSVGGGNSTGKTWA